jgi:branched-chain amino acid transport system substrate-binding protein
MKKACCSLVALVAALSVQAGLAAAEIRIAVVGPTTGQYAEFGRQIVRGAERAVADINAAGGVNGERLLLDVADDACDPRKAVEAARTLVARHIAFVAGHFCSFASIPAAPVYAAAGVVMISPAASAPKFTDEGDWNVHRVCPRDDAQGTFAGRYVAEKYPGVAVAVVDDGTPFSKLLTERFRAAVVQGGGKVALSASFRQGDKDFSALSARIRSAGVGVVYMGGYHPELGLLAARLRADAVTAQLIAADTLVTDEYGTIAGAAAEGTLMTFPMDPMGLATAAAIVRDFQDHDIVPEGHTLHAYAAVQAWAAAAAMAGTTEGRAVASELRSGRPIATVLGDIAFDAKGDLKAPVFAWYRWTAGRYVELKDTD